MVSIADWLLGRGGCTREQRDTWDRFVDSFTASTINGGSPQVAGEHVQGPESGTPVSYFPAAKRLVAIGDLHGDYNKAVRAFKVAGLVDDAENWVGGDTVAVQVGDVLDRGGEEIRIFHFLEKLKGQAAGQGGAVHVLNGNHEVMNVAGRFRYATESAMDEFERWEKVRRFGLRLKCLCSDDRAGCGSRIPPPSASGAEARRRALRPGGPLSTAFLARHPVALVVGSSVFVHGGLHPTHLEYGIRRMNREASEWIRGDSADEAVPWFLSGRNAIVWSRQYSMPSERQCDCEMLREALTRLPGARRMVVGHTVQHPMGINGACGGTVFRVDVGASSGVADADPEVLEIIEDREVRRLRANQQAQVLVSAQEAAKAKAAAMKG